MPMNNLVLAYLGDAVYELYVREYLINSGLAKVNDLQKRGTDFVSAKSQTRILEKLINSNALTDEEMDIVMRGRNAKSHASKNTDIITYKKSTGFETLIGYLYLNDKDRLDELMKGILL